MGTRLLILFVLASALPLLASGAYVVSLLSSSSRARAGSSLESDLAKARLVLERRIDEVERFVLAASRDNLVAINLELSLSSPVVDYLQRSVETQSLDRAAIIGPGGAPWAQAGADASSLVGAIGAGAFSEAEAGGSRRFAARVPADGSGGGALALGSIVPVRDYSNSLLGYVVAAVDLGGSAAGGASRTLAELSEAAGSPAFVVSGGEVLAASGWDPLPRAFAPLDGASLAGLADGGLERIAAGSEPYLFRFAALAGPEGAPAGFLGVGIREADFLAETRRSLQGFLLVLVGSIVGSSILSFLFSRGVARPLRRLVEATRLIVAGDFGARVLVGSRDEVGVLAREFNDMAARLGDSASALRAEVAVRARAEAEVVALNRDLEARIDERTRELLIANRELEQTIRDLGAARGKLVEAEKLAALGQLVASIAHEVNTPLGAIISSSESMAACLADVLAELPSFAASLSGGEREAFDELFAKAIDPPPIEGPLARGPRGAALEESLARAGVENPEDAADELSMIGVDSLGPEALAALAGGSGARMLELVEKAAWTVRSRQIIALAADKAAKTVRALKSYARLDSGGEESEFDLGEEIDAILAIYYGKIKLGVELRKDYRGIPPIRGRRDSLSQVWFNLINNALQAMDYKGALEVSIFPAEGGMIGVSFTDDGPGVPEESRSRIFDAFFTTKPPGEGSGLGLSIAKKIVEEHGGRISFESRPGRTTFTALLPSPGVR